MEKNMRIVIVGGVAGGASAAARARRLSEQAEIIMFERGGHVSFANCGLPYHIGGRIADRDKLLVQTPQALRRRFNIDARIHSEVLRIDRQAKTIAVRDLTSGREYLQPYDALILSPGAEPIRPDIPGASSSKVFTLRSMADMDAIKSAIDERKPASAVVIGGGYIGLEMTEALRERGIAVSLVERNKQVFGPVDAEMAAPIHQQLELHGVELLLGTSVTAFAQRGESLSVQLSSGRSIECGLAIMAIGVQPDVKLAGEAGLVLGPSGGIAVDEHMRTSDENILAVGDAVEVVDFVTGQAALVPLAGPANRQGRIAADNIFGRRSVYRKTQGTAICKVFDLTVGLTGRSEKTLKRSAVAYEKVYVHPASHASYYPGATSIDLKLLFDPKTGRILGAQAVGADGVDKRIDVLAVAIRAGMTVFDLEDLELSYAPPYGSAKDPINYAGFVAANVIRGDVQICHADDIAKLTDQQVLLDVRTAAEVEAGTIPGAINIPLDELRSRLAELPKGREILAFCQVGLRGYLACRILAQHGFACRNLSGGYKTYTAAMGSPAAQAFQSVSAQIFQAVPPSPRETQSRQAVGSSGPARQVDATGLQCPGPIMKLKGEIDKLKAGESLTLIASDSAFAADVKSWCASTGNDLIDLACRDGKYLATVRKTVGTLNATMTSTAEPTSDLSRNKTLVVFSGDFDKAMAAFIIANGAAAMGSKVTMFFTFWGLNVLRRREAVRVKKNAVEKMFGWMMPRGAGKLGLSKMNMGGLGLAMIKGIMKKKNVAPLDELIASARKAGVRLVACSMSMDLMGIKREELLEGVEEGGVATYLNEAQRGAVNLFI